MTQEVLVSVSPRPYIESDPVTEMLGRQGVEVYNHYLPGTSIVIGGRIQWVDCELVYRVDPADTLIIVFFQRLHERAGLKNSFRDLVRFCDFIAGHVPEINTVTGTTIPTLTVDEGGIAAERLLAIYRRYIAMELRDGRVYFDLKRYREKKRRDIGDYSWITKVVNGGTETPG